MGISLLFQHGSGKLKGMYMAWVILVIAGLCVLIGSTVVVGYGNYLAAEPSAEAHL